MSAHPVRRTGAKTHHGPLDMEHEAFPDGILIRLTDPEDEHFYAEVFIRPKLLDMMAAARRAADEYAQDRGDLPAGLFLDDTPADPAG